MKKKTEQPDKILKIVEEVFDFNKRIRKQQGFGLSKKTYKKCL